VGREIFVKDSSIKKQMLDNITCTAIMYI